jgi:hypothetical protein
VVSQVLVMEVLLAMAAVEANSIKALETEKFIKG